MKIHLLGAEVSMKAGVDVRVAAARKIRKRHVMSSPGKEAKTGKVRPRRV